MYSGRPVRGMISTGTAIYAVIRHLVYKLTPSTGGDLTYTELGTIGTIGGPVSMAMSALEIIIVDGTSGYTVSLSTDTVAEITDSDFPNGVTWVQYLDGYFIVGGDGSQRFYISGLLNGNTWVGTEYASAEGDPDPLVAGIVDHRELWLFGSSTTEIWYNTGNADFPFERTGNAFIEHGCAARASVAKLDNTVFWLGQDARGEGIIWRAEGYIPQRVSTHAIEYAISQYSRVDDAIAYTYQQEGHAFYVLTFPSGNATWVYDVATGAWHERAYRDPITGELGRHRSNCHAMLGRYHYVGDYRESKVYILDLDEFTDNGDIIKRIRTTTATDNNMQRVIYQYLELDCEKGVGNADCEDPQVMLRWSNDRGHTWSNYRYASLGKVGEYGKRVKWEQLGAGRGRVWEISVTDPVKAAILGATMMAVAGTS